MSNVHHGDGQPQAAPTAWTTLRVAHTAHSHYGDDGGEPIFDDQVGLFSVDKNSTPGPRRGATLSVFDKLPEPQNEISQELAKNNDIGGRVSVFFYDNLEDRDTAYVLLVGDMVDEVESTGEVGEADYVTVFHDAWATISPPSPSLAPEPP